MTLYYERLLKAGSSCSPDARFLLEVVASDPERILDPGLEFSVKPLAKRLHLEERVVSTAFNDLVDAGVMELRLATRSGRGGRAATSYKLCLSTVSALSEATYPLHEELLCTIFSNADMAFAVLGRVAGKKVDAAVKRGRRQPPGGRGRLSIRNRLLLAVLLVRADQFGEVQIGLPELGRCVGMRPEQVKNRLSRLMALGIIRRYVPGLASSIFTGGRVSTTYFLNLDLLGSRGGIAVHLAYDMERKRFTHVDRLFGGVQHFAKGGRSRMHKAPQSVLQFLKQEREAVFILLYHLINGYASRLLSRHWESLGSGKTVVDGELMQLIRADLRCPLAEPEISGKFDEICEYFYALAIEVALEYRDRFGQANWIDFTSGEIRILPAAEHVGYGALTVMIRPAPTGLGGIRVFHDIAPDDMTIWPERDEDELELESRLRFGLVTLQPRVGRSVAR